MRNPVEAEDRFKRVKQKKLSPRSRKHGFKVCYAEKPRNRH